MGAGIMKNNKKETISPSKKNSINKGGIIAICKSTITKLLQINATTRSIALGSAIGFSVTLTPLFGLQIALTILLDLLFGANIAASMITSIIGNPLTFPLIWTANYKLGKLFLSTNTTISQSSFITQVESIISAIRVSDWEIIRASTYSILLPMLIGGAIMAIVSGITVYVLTVKYLKQHKNNGDKTK